MFLKLELVDGLERYPSNFPALSSYAQGSAVAYLRQCYTVWRINSLAYKCKWPLLSLGRASRLFGHTAATRPRERTPFGGGGSPRALVEVTHVD